MMTARVIHIYNVIFSYDTGTNTMSGHESQGEYTWTWGRSWQGDSVAVKNKYLSDITARYNAHLLFA